MFEFELYPYYNDAKSEWIKDHGSFVCMTSDPEIIPWNDTPHILKQYQGQNTLTIDVGG